MQETIIELLKNWKIAVYFVPAVIAVGKIGMATAQANRCIRQSETKIRLKRKGIGLFIIFELIACLCFIPLSIYGIIDSINESDSVSIFYGCLILGCTALLLFTVVMIALFGRYFVLTEDAIYTPAMVYSQITDFKWSIDGDRLTIVRNGRKFKSRYIIMGDAEEARFILEKNF